MPNPPTNNDASTLLKQAVQFYQHSQPQKAKHICETLCKSGSDDPQVWCLLSATNSQLGLHQQALQCAQRASQIASDYDEAYYHTGAALINLERPGDAIKPFKKLINLNPQHVQGRLLLGMAYLYSSHFELAIECYQILREKYPNDANINCRLADAYERTHRLKEASALIEHALSFEPNHIELNVFAARIERRNDNFEAAYQRLSRIKYLASTSHDHETILNELGLTCDKSGKHSEAFTAFSECNSITTERYGNIFNYKTFINRINRYKSAINEESLSSWVEYTQTKDEPVAPIFLLGFPRSGTTLTEQIIASHPAVSASNELPIITSLTAELPTLLPGKIADFPFGLENLNQDDIKLLRSEYWKRVKNFTGHTISGKRYLDKLPLNLVELGFIIRIFPEAKIIFACRDPRDVCLSCFFQRFRSNNAMAAFEDINTTAELYKSTLDIWLHYKKVFNLKFYESKYEDLTINFEGNARNLIEFIEEPWDDSVLEYNVKDHHRNVLTPSYQDISKPVYTKSVGRWKNYATELNSILPVLTPYVKLLGYEN